MGLPGDGAPASEERVCRACSRMAECSRRSCWPSASASELAAPPAQVAARPPEAAAHPARLLSEYWRAGADFAERRDAGASAAAGADVRVEEVSAGDASTAEVRLAEVGAAGAACAGAQDLRA
ncbi:unnamed protein product, partial [Prorocentrum cordatum]